MVNDCIFCKIAEGAIPCTKVYEDDVVLAFLDRSQTTVGHTLVISKKHYENFLAVPKSVMHHVLDVAQRIGQAEIQNLGAKGINILTNCYPAAGQSVMHFHVHVIPRYETSDGFRLEMKENSNIRNLNLPVVAKQISNALTNK